MKEQYLDEKLLYDLYIKENYTYTQLCEYFDCGISFIKKQLRLYNIKKPRSLLVKNIQKSCLKKYGVLNGGCAPETLKKIALTNKKRYGDSCYFKTKDYFNKKKKYLLDNNIINVFQLPTVKDKIRQTNLKRYGVEHNMQSEKVREKVYTTKAKNKTFNTSKPEEYIYKKLLSYFPEVLRQYKSEEYPFACDFYIPNLKLYIEYQGSWTHGFRPFKGSCEDLSVLQRWQERSKPRNMYESAINVWTNRDVKKREYAKDNALNWIEFFTLEEFENWFYKRCKL